MFSLFCEMLKFAPQDINSFLHSFTHSFTHSFIHSINFSSLSRTVRDSGTTGIHELSKEYCISFKVLGRGSLKIFQHGSDGSKTAVTPGRRLWFSHSGFLFSHHFSFSLI